MTASVTSAVSAADVLRQALDREYAWPSTFHGFEAGLRLSTEFRTVSGKVWVTGARGLTVNLDDDAGEEEWEWGIEQLRSLALHRWPRHRALSALTFPTRYADGSVFVPDEGSGVVVAIDDPMRSRYRIQDRHIAEIDQQLPSLRLRVLIRDRTPAPDGSSLPRHSTTILSDLDGNIRAVDVLTDDWQISEAVAWPTRREASIITGSGVVTRSLELFAHRQLVPEVDRGWWLADGPAA